MDTVYLYILLCSISFDIYIPLQLSLTFVIILIYSTRYVTNLYWY